MICTAFGPVDTPFWTQIARYVSIGQPVGQLFVFVTRCFYFLKTKMYDCYMMYTVASKSKATAVFILLHSICISFADREVDEGGLSYFLKSLVI